MNYTLTFADGIGFVNESFSGFESGCFNNYTGACDTTNYVTDVVNAIDKSDLNVFPVPSSSYVDVTSAENFRSAVLYNSLGKLVWESSEGFNGRVDISTLATGLYVIILSNGYRTARTTIIKQ
jgi:hypothetical protein